MFLQTIADHKMNFDSFRSDFFQYFFFLDLSTSMSWWISFRTNSPHNCTDCQSLTMNKRISEPAELQTQITQLDNKLNHRTKCVTDDLITDKN